MASGFHDADNCLFPNNCTDAAVPQTAPPSIVHAFLKLIRQMSDLKPLIARRGLFAVHYLLTKIASGRIVAHIRNSSTDIRKQYRGG
jgi:hypothetical protein